jgi:hypothetical protein
LMRTYWRVSIPLYRIGLQFNLTEIPHVSHAHGRDCFN